MQQQIQLNQPADRALTEAAGFLSKRRAKVSDRNERGFRFGLPGGAGEGGRVTVAPSPGGTCMLTVEADGLGVLAMAEGLVRELRKQAKDQGRGGQRDGGGTTMRGDFSALRERLGMPAPERPVRVQESTPSDRPRTAAAPEPADGRPEINAEAPPQREHVHGHEGPPQTATQPPHEQDVALGRPPSAEESGGVPAAEHVLAGEPSETAKAHSGPGSHGSEPVVDPSTPNTATTGTEMTGTATTVTTTTGTGA